MSSIEQTLSIIKPDAVERNIGNEIKEIFVKNGFKENLFDLIPSFLRAIKRF